MPPPFVAVRGRCDLSCAWCNYAGVAPVESGGEVARVTAEIEHLRADGAAGIGFGFLHTEPTTHGGFVDIVRRATAIGFAQITLSTSGMRLADPSYVDELRRAGVTRVILSFAGLGPELGDVLIGRAGATAAKLRALDNGIAAGLGTSVALMFLRPVLAEMARDAAVLQEGTRAARDRVVVHGTLLDPVAGMPAARMQALWPTYGEIAWTMTRVHERVGDFELHSRYAPPCARDGIIGLSVVDYGVAVDGPFTRSGSVCDPCPAASRCPGVPAPLGVCGAALLSTTPVVPPSVSITELAANLAATRESRGGATGAWAPGPRGDGWPAATQQIGGGAAPLGYRLRGFEVRGDELWISLRDPEDELELTAIVEQRSRAERYFARGRRFALSCATGTPAGSDRARRVLQQLLATAEERQKSAEYQAVAEM